MGSVRNGSRRPPEGHAESMSSRTDPRRSSEPDSGRPSARGFGPRQRWGYITHATSRYGSHETELVVYPPDSSEQDRLWATSVHAYAPFAAGATVIAALAVVLAGVSPAHAFPVMIAVLAGGGVIVFAKTVTLRRRTRSIWVGVSAIHPDADRARLQAHLVELAETMTVAEDAVDDGRMSADDFARIWNEVFIEVTALEARHDGTSTAA